MPIDNLSSDSEGSVYAAGFPDVMKLVKGFKDPDKGIPSTVFKISQIADGSVEKEEGKGNVEWEVEKLVEDSEGGVAWEYSCCE